MRKNSPSCNEAANGGYPFEDFIRKPFLGCVPAIRWEIEEESINHFGSLSSVLRDGGFRNGVEQQPLEKHAAIID